MDLTSIDEPFDGPLTAEPPKCESAKASILSRVMQEGHTDSYGVLLHLVAVMGREPKALNPRTEKELAEWSGHFRGLKAALLCLVMHEQKVEPGPAAVVVCRHIEDASDELDRRSGTGTGG
ncbi:hypothetical protein [Catenulispora rubra]|uniref:hypothetical protein n=1 Tax=Catenulispora rubra TaxID=280293 RepID=UPI0018924428|nr:hypothetical protein [Catenulispora rubra]